MSKADTSRIAQRRQAALAEGGAEYMAKRQELIRTAALVFREKGYTSATLNDVAAEFGTDRASLYYYVASKEELFHECIRGTLDDNLAQGRQIVAMAITPRQKIEKLLTVVMASYEKNFPYMYVYIQEDMSQVASLDSDWATKMVSETKRFERLFLDVLKEGIADGSFRNDLPVTLVANSLFGMLNWTHRWYVPGRKVTADAVASTFAGIFFDGVGA